ncbi:MAG TPA: pectate lyase-like adhesive domain-containing protein [Erysipelothrix sp.]
MKKTIKNTVVVLVFALVLSVSVPSFAQDNYLENDETINENTIHEGKENMNEPDNEVGVKEHEDHTSLEEGDYLAEPSLNNILGDEDNDTIEALQDDSTEINVNSWTEFISAFNDEKNTVINLSQDIAIPSSSRPLNTRIQDIEINGGKHKLSSDLDGDLFTISQESNPIFFNLHDIEIVHKQGSVIKTNDDFVNEPTLNIQLKNLEIRNEEKTPDFIIKGNAINSIELTEDVNVSANKAIIESTQAEVNINNAQLTTNQTILAKTIDANNSIIKMDTIGNALQAEKVILRNLDVCIEAKKNAITADKTHIENSKLELESGVDTIKSTNVLFKDVNATMTANENVINASATDNLERWEWISLKIDNSNIKMSSIGENNRGAIYMGAPDTNLPIRINIDNGQLSRELKSNVEICASNKSENTAVVMIEKAETASTGETRYSQLTVDNGAQLNIQAKDMMALNFRDPSGVSINSYGKSQLVIKQEISQSDGIPVINVEKSTANSSALVASDSNVIIETDALSSPVIQIAQESKIDIVGIAEGNLVLRNKGTVNTTNQSQHKGSVINDLSNEQTSGEVMMTVLDTGNVLLESENGKVIKTSKELSIVIHTGTFEIKGNTEKKEIPVIDTDKFRLQTSKAAYFNIENKRKNGGLIFPLSEEGVKLSISEFGHANKLDMPFAVWKHETSLEGDPSLYWSQLDVQFSEEKKGLTKQEHEDGHVLNYKDFDKFSRISGNNAQPIIDFDYPAADTDCSIYGHVTVPEGLNGSRNAWEGEVQLEIERTQADASKTVYDDISTQKPGVKAWGYEDYKIPKERWGGFFELALDEFAVAGDYYEIISAYRGQKDQEEERHIHSDLDESEKIRKTVHDKTPPEIAKIESPVFEDQATMTGETAEKGVTAKLYDKDECEIKDNDGKPLEVSDVEGKWEFDISNTKLKKGDKVYVVLKDKKGNFNPFEKSSYHDATFEASASIIISGPRFEISADDLFTNQKGIVKINNKDSLKNKMNAKGHDKLNGDIEVEITDLGGLNFEQSEIINEVKSHEITFKLKDYDTTIIKSVYILPHDNIVQTKEYVIGANDFYTDKKDIDAKEDRVKELANAKAYKKEDMSEQEVHLQDFEKLQFDLPNELKFVVEANEKVAITVIGRVLNYDHVNNSDKYVVAANDFSIWDYDAAVIANETILTKSKAVGWKIENWVEVPVKIVKHDIKGKEGTYNATIDID